MLTEFLFVYGTLRKAIAHNMHQVLINHANYISDGYLLGRLYDVNHYPAAILSNGDDKVFGELYQLNNANTVFSLLDDYEECSYRFTEPHEYKRVLENIMLNNSTNQLAWVYCYNQDISTLKQITSGDYVSYRYQN